MNLKSINRFTITVIFSLIYLSISAVNAEDPNLGKDETWLSINGTVAKADPDSFILDYGKGLITVEIGKLKWYEKYSKIMEGDRVSVYGKIDDDMFETASIEAGIVYDSKLGHIFYAAPKDEEGENRMAGYWRIYVTDDINSNDIVVQGTVTSVTGTRFTIDTGTRMVTVNTTKMSYNPLDDKGYQVIKKGDYVRVRGILMNYDFLINRTFYADSIVTIVR